MLGLALERKAGRAKEMVETAKVKKLSAVTRKSLVKGGTPDHSKVKQEENDTVLPELQMAKMLGHRIRYFTSGAVIGSKMFVNEVFASAKERFSSRRRDGARAMRGNAQAARGQLWSMRDLKA